MIETFQDTEKANVTKGFSMTFDNGNVISIQFGKGDYSDNRKEANSKSANAEISIWNKDLVYYKINGNERSKGWCDTNEIAKWIDFAANNTF